jgi:hypothetical protein
MMDFYPANLALGAHYSSPLQQLLSKEEQTSFSECEEECLVVLLPEIGEANWENPAGCGMKTW